MRPNDILICIIVLEIIFILCFSHKSELLKEEIVPIVTSSLRLSTKNKIIYVIASSMSIIIPLTVSYYVARATSNKFKINYILMMVFIWINILIYVEYKMSHTHYLSDEEEDVQIALDRSHTGDFIFARNYHSLDIGDLMMFRVIASIIDSAPFYSHVGMIIKINGVAHVIENTHDIRHCVHANQLKSGVILSNAYDMIHASGRVHLSRNNLHNYIRYEDIIKFMDKYGHLLFLDNNLMCSTTIRMFLQFANIFNSETNFLTINNLNNPELYTCDFKNIENVELKNKYYYDNLQNQ